MQAIIGVFYVHGPLHYYVQGAKEYKWPSFPSQLPHSICLMLSYFGMHSPDYASPIGKVE